MIPNITTGADFGELLDYLIEHRHHELLDMRGVSSVALAAEEMAAVAALSHRAKVKLIHLSLSAAHEDGKLSDDTWIQAVDRHERAFGLKGHQRIVVRHKDKTHDHVHVFWCTISIETGQTPPKRWFLRKGFAVDGIGPQALTDEQMERVPAAHRARRTYDFILLRRAQHLCRQLEREFKLRELRSPQQAAKARLAGEERAPSVGQQKRAERTGAEPLIGRAEEIRAALDQPDWPSKRRALVDIGLDLEPVFRTTNKGEEVRGIVIFDRADPGNRMKASQLDTASMKYGWQKLEERLPMRAASLEEWWPQRAPVRFAGCEQAVRPAIKVKAQFDLVLEQHRLLQAENGRELKRLEGEYKRIVAAKRRALMRDRKGEAAELPVAQRRVFYASYDRRVRAPALADLAEDYRRKALPFQRSRQPSWQEFLRASAEAGDIDAARLIAKKRIEDMRVPSIAQVQQPTLALEVSISTIQPKAEDLSPAFEAQALTPQQILGAILQRREHGR